MALLVHAQFQTGWTTLSPWNSLRPMPVQALRYGAMILIDLEKVALHPALKRGPEGRLGPQRRNSGGPKAQAAGPRRLLHHATPGRTNSVGEGRSHPHGPRPTQGVEGDGWQGGVRATRQLGHSPPGHGMTQLMSSANLPLPPIAFNSLNWAWAVRMAPAFSDAVASPRSRVTKRATRTGCLSFRASTIPRLRSETTFHSSLRAGCRAIFPRSMRITGP